MQPQARRRFRFLVPLVAALVAVGFADPAVAAARNTVTNSNFESSLRGWHGYRASLRAVRTGALDRGSVLVVPRNVRGPAAVSHAPRPVRDARRGATYTARARVRTKGPIKNVCLRIREVRRERTVKKTRACKRVGRSWTRLVVRRHTARANGDVLGVAIVGTGRRAFLVDNVRLARKHPVPTRRRPIRRDGMGRCGVKYVKCVYLGNGAFSSGPHNCSRARLGKAPPPRGHRALQRGGAWDYFRLPDCGNAASERATWVAMSFTRMQQKDVYEWWQVVDSMPSVYGGQSGSTHSVRQTDASLSSGCDGGGNRDSIALSVGFFDTHVGSRRFGVKANGGPDSPCSRSARHYSTIDLGRVRVGHVYHWKVDVFWSHLPHKGYAKVWLDGRLVDPNRDGFTFRGPIGYRLAPNGDNIANSNLRLQHGFYRHPYNKSTWVERTSGFGFRR